MKNIVIFSLFLSFNLMAQIKGSDSKSVVECTVTKEFITTLEFLRQSSSFQMDEKIARDAREAFPIIKNVFENPNNQYERIVVPFTDGQKVLNVVTDLKKAYDSEGVQLVADFEKNITLAIVDEAWKKHLRKMDELKQSVQLAVHEQKDPLLIYKFEAFNLFKTMLDKVNKEVISFLFKGNLPSQNTSNIQEARDNRPKENYKTSKDEIPNSDNLAAQNRQAGQTQRPQITETIVRETPKINRNDTVTVKHILTGKTESMKYKKAEPLLAKGEWVLVQE
jgi:preprotein translocase subunit SecA